MKNILVLISILFFANIILEAQTQKNSTYGDYFTPHGDLRVLYIAV